MGSEYPFVRIHSIMYLLEYYIQIILFYIHNVAINILVHLKKKNIYYEL